MARRRVTPRCKLKLKHVEYKLDRAIQAADRHGYTGMVKSKGSLFDYSPVKRLMRQRDKLLLACAVRSKKR